MLWGKGLEKGGELSNLGGERLGPGGGILVAAGPFLGEGGHGGRGERGKGRWDGCGMVLGCGSKGGWCVRWGREEVSGRS